MAYTDLNTNSSTENKDEHIKYKFSAKYCNPSTQLAVIRVRHGPHRLVGSCLPFVRGVKNNPMTIRLLYTGATLKHCFKFAVKYQKEALLKMWSSLPNDSVKKQMKESLMDLSGFANIDKSFKVAQEFGGKASAVTSSAAQLRNS